MVAKIPEIISYWSNKKDDSFLGVEWEDAAERCWRCAYKARLDRCHIIPKSMGGKDDPSNLVLLCKKCHKEAPNVKDENFMWQWIERTNSGMYDTYWTLRTFTEFEMIFGRKPFSVGEFKEIENIHVIIKETLKGYAIAHYGESGFNLSTLVSLIKKLEDEFISGQ